MIRLMLIFFPANAFTRLSNFSIPVFLVFIIISNTVNNVFRVDRQRRSLAPHIHSSVLTHNGHSGSVLILATCAAKTALTDASRSLDVLPSRCPSVFPSLSRQGFSGLNDRCPHPRCPSLIYLYICNNRANLQKTKRKNTFRYSYNDNRSPFCLSFKAKIGKIKIVSK